MTYPVRHVANCFLQKDFADGKASITPMKMQKLVYFLHGWHLAVTGKPAIADEFRAWQYGPVEENLYHMLKKHRGSPITAYLKEERAGEETAFVVAKSEEMFHKVLDMVWHKYGHFSAIQLSAMTHEKGTPWDEVYNHRDDLPAIPNAMIKEYFDRKIARE